MRKSIVKSALLCGSFVLLTAPCLAQNGLNYHGYSFKKYSNSTTNVSTAIVKKGNKILARHAEGFGDYGATEFELLPILGKKNRQLVITQFTGGIHCCRRYWVYDLKPVFRLIFQSKDYFIGDGGDSGEGTFQNLDNDKELELVDRNDAFLYFDDLAYVSSPRPLLVFDYNHRAGRFVLANRKFSSYLLKDQINFIAQTKETRNVNTGQYSVNMFSVLLDYIYAGKEQVGWNYYRSERAAKNPLWNFHDEAKIKAVLRKDKAYKLIYPR